jgi:putative transposase
MGQSINRILVHLVFSTKLRRPFLTDGARPELHAYMAGILRRIGCQVYAINSVDDHIHLLFVLARMLSSAHTISKLKSASSRWLRSKGGPLADFAWQSGYAAFSVAQGKRDIGELCRYIGRQREHHGVVDFQSELRTMLDEAGLDFDEMFV